MAYGWESAVSVAFFVASFVHGATGFGAGMTAMAIAPLVLPMLDTVAIVAVFVLLVCLVLAVQLRGSLSNPKVLATLPPLCLGSLIGAPLGVKLLTTTDPRLLKILLGASMLAFVVERLIHEIQLSQSRPGFVELTEGMQRRHVTATVAATAAPALAPSPHPKERCPFRIRPTGASR